MKDVVVKCPPRIEWVSAVRPCESVALISTIGFFAAEHENSLKHESSG